MTRLRTTDAPFVTRDRMIIFKRWLRQHEEMKARLHPVPEGWVRLMQSKLEELLGSRERRIEFYNYIFDQHDIASTNDLEDWQRFALVRWAAPAKLMEDGPWTFDKQFKDDCFVIKTILIHYGMENTHNEYQEEYPQEARQE